MHKFDTLIMFAFRYALGRRSAAPSIMVDIIRAQDVLKTLHDDTLRRIHKEIMEALDTGAAGDPCDEKEWQELADVLESELLKRGGNDITGVNTRCSTCLSIPHYCVSDGAERTICSGCYKQTKDRYDGDKQSMDKEWEELNKQENI